MPRCLSVPRNVAFLCAGSCIRALAVLFSPVSAYRPMSIHDTDLQCMMAGMELWKHIRAVLLLPGMAAAVIPATLLYFTGTDSLGLRDRIPVSQIVLPVIGVLLAGVGLVLMVSTIWLFAVAGKGTLAPWDPTQRLVVRGVYGHVRNPMISGVSFVLLGEAVGCGSLPVLGWCAFFIVGNAIYMPLVEEPGLVQRFGEAYEDYRRNVPRWLPRVSRWKPGGEPTNSR
jgi:protein-S-isoprenylcysteine O-methyltransferase Ste14